MYQQVEKSGKMIKKRVNQIGIRITDEHMKKLVEYCKATGASPAGAITVLVESYVQAMIDRGTFISPSLENLSCKELLLVAEKNDRPYEVKKTPRKGAA